MAKRSWKEALKADAILLAGLVLMALSFDLFFVPSAIAPGGLTGLATVFHVLWGWPVGLVSALLNLPLFLIGWRSMGRTFAVRSFAAMLLLSLLLDLLPIVPLTQDRLLSAVFGGVLLGAGLALVLMGNATTGGTDLAAAMLRRLLPGLPFGRLLLLVESCVVLVSALTLGADVTLYAVVALAVSSRLIDAIQAGLEEGRLFFVISRCPREIGEAVMQRLNRGVTLLSGRGAYSGMELQVLFCVVTRGQVLPFKRLVQQIDPSAFVVLANVRETMGEGFGKLLPPT